ncbi:MAG TPA: glycosyltransferase family 9 protein [Chitinophagaceae bacterium]|nr:glycosyltransferase family 9 protein [Chitinophagaceae bacterium]
MKKRFILAPPGALTDWLLCTPAFKALKDAYPDHKVILYASRRAYKNMRAVMANNPSVDAVRNKHWKGLLRYPYDIYLFLAGLHKMMDFKKKHISLKSVSYYKLHYFHVGPSYIYKKNVKDIIPETLSLRTNNSKVLLYFTEKEDEKAKAMLAPYDVTVIMHTSSKLSYNQYWHNDNWKALVKALPHLTFIHVGDPAGPSVEGALDWRRKLTIRETLCLVKHATSFVGVNSSYSHATNAFDKPGVVLFGDSSPVHWGHSNNINIYKNTSCSPCVDLLRGNKCPFNHECMDMITVEEVKQALIKQVSSIPVISRNISRTTEKIFKAESMQTSISVEPGLFFL